jgi:PEP-CTERM motif
MNAIQKAELASLMVMAFGFPASVRCQDYYVSAPITGWTELGITDYGSSSAWPSGLIQLTFGTLTEHLYLDPVLHTARQVGTVSVIPSAPSILFHETQQVNGQPVAGDVTVYQQLVGGSLFIDTGPLPYSWNDSLHAFRVGQSNPGDGRQPADIGRIQVEGSYSLATGEQTYTGTFAYSLYSMGIPAETFSLFSTDSGPSLSVDGLASGGGGGISVYRGTLSGASFTADDGFCMALGAGVSDGTDYFQWSCDPATATLVPEPSTLVLFALAGAFLSLRCRKLTP